MCEFLFLLIYSYILWFYVFFKFPSSESSSTDEETDDPDSTNEIINSNQNHLPMDLEHKEPGPTEKLGT